MHTNVWSTFFLHTIKREETLIKMREPLNANVHSEKKNNPNTKQKNETFVREK
jgi:hypothetical protein